MAQLGISVSRKVIPKELKETADPLYEALQQFIRNYYYKRRNALTMFWDYWRGDQTKYLRKYEGESHTEYRERLERAVVENQCKTTININAAFMYGLSDKISRRAENQELNEILAKDVYYHNDMATFMMDTRLMTGITGNSLVELMVYDKATRKPFDPKKRVEKGNFYVHYTLNDSSVTVPLPRINDRRALGAVIKYYELEDVDEYEVLGLDFDPGVRIWILEYVTDDLWLRWYHEGNDQANAQLIPVFNKVGQENINPYGDVRIPFVLFKNIGDPMNLDGESDIEDVIPLQNSLNERMTDDALVISYHAVPIVKFLKGAKMPRNFIRKRNSALEFDGEGDAEYLTWEDKLEASQKTKAETRTAISEVTQISGLTRGNMQGAGQLRTGIGVKTMFVPDIIGVRMRRPYMMRGERELVYSTAKLYEFYGKYDFGMDYRCEIFMPEDFLGIDEWMETQVKALKIQSGMPMTQELKEEFPELSDEQIKKLEDKLLAGALQKPGAPQDQKQLEKE